MVDYIVLFIVEFLYIALRTSNVSSIVRGSVVRGSIEVMFLQGLWVVSTALGVNSFVNDDSMITLIIVVSSGVIGYNCARYFNKRIMKKDE